MKTYGEYGQVVKVKLIRFDDYNDKFYSRIFEELKDEKYIRGNYNDEKWEIYNDNTTYYHTLYFDSSIQIYTYIKNYILLRLSMDRAADTVIKNYYDIKRVVVASNDLTDFEGFKKHFETTFLKTNNRSKTYVNSIINFFEFYNTNETKVFNKYLINTKQRNNLSKSLPNFEDVLKLDGFINLYFNNISTSNPDKFYPIFLWWTIGNIIPLRVSEFLSLKKNCLICDMSRENPYSLIVPRRKELSSYRKKHLNEDEIYIDKNTYNKLNDIISLFSKTPSETDYLFSKEVYYKYVQTKEKYKKSKSMRMNASMLLRLVKNFYKEVIYEKYNVTDLSFVQPSHTRHLAIINMALQGVNILSIARLAGHKKIESAEVYYSHAETFAQSYVFKLAKTNNEMILKGSIPEGLIGWKNHVINKGKLYEDIILSDNTVGRINIYGHCTEDKSVFPSSCITDCRLCKKFLFQPEDNDFGSGINWLKDSSDFYEQKIKEIVHYMLDISIKVTGDNEQEIDANLRTKANELNSIITMKALIESHLQGVKFND